MSMKSIDKVKLGERLLTYFKKSGCEVQVTKQVVLPKSLNSYREERAPRLKIFKLSPHEFKPGKFQSLVEIWQHDSWAVNSNWDHFMKEVVNEYCGTHGTSIGFSSSEFVTASSPEELDLKLSLRGF